MKRKLECNELNEEEVQSKIQILNVESMDKEELCEISEGMEINIKEEKEENIVSDEKVFLMQFNVGKCKNNVELMQRNDQNVSEGKNSTKGQNSDLSEDSIPDNVLSNSSTGQNVKIHQQETENLGMTKMLIHQIQTMKV